MATLLDELRGNKGIGEFRYDILSLPLCIYNSTPTLVLAIDGF